MDDMCCCPVCMNQFHGRNYVPKILDCSHTFCANCVQQLCESSRQCPTCRKEMTKTEYPTNLIFLKLLDHINESSHKATSSDNIKCAKEIKKIKLKVIRKLERSIQGSCNFNNRVKFFNNKLHVLNEVQEKCKELVTEETFNFILQVKEDLSDEEPDEEEEEEGAQGISVSLEKEIFENEDAFMAYVVRRVRGEIAFWFADVKEKTRCGKLTLQDKYFLFHTLSYLRGDIGQGVTLVRDLAPLPPSAGMEAFLVFEGGPDGPQVEVRVRLLPLHPFTNTFLLLCTGQRGPSYKGAPVEDERGEDYGSRSGLFYVRKYVDDGREKRGPIEPLPRGGRVERDCEPGEVVLGGVREGGFWLYKITKRARFDWIVGVVTSPSLSDLESFDWGRRRGRRVRGKRQVRVKECGIRVPI